MLSGIIYNYKNHDVASLAWAIASPPLIGDARATHHLGLVGEEWCANQFEMHGNWLRELDDNPAPILDWLAADNQKLLGRRFESLLAFWFTYSPFFELITKNIQLKSGANTSGEIDFVVKDKETGDLLHFETACKYYLAGEVSSDWSKWIGPNGHDTLFRKMEKLKSQVSIFNTSPGKDFLKNEQLQQPASYTFLKGYFFHEYSKMHLAKAPKYAHPHYQSGWYVREKDLGVFSDQIPQWLVLPKSHWMCPYNFTLGDFQLLSGREMKDACIDSLHLKRKAQMVMQVEMENDIAHEISRGFVIMNKWP